ncbi:MAG: 23S rRNA pseudouridine(2604) synthase RluF [Myxococcota bacterium]
MFGKRTLRLNKYISESGICSRREADRFIEDGAVLINGRRARIGDQVGAGDLVRVNGQTIEPRHADEIVLIALNKPVGIVSTTEQSERDNIVRYVNHPVRLFPVGRLDKDSQGLIFLTNDGDIVNRILRAGNEHEKEYVVTVDRPITEAFIAGMAAGVPMLGTRTKRCLVEALSEFVFRIVLVQGLNRQIRRMCEHFGYGVVRLERTRIMNITLAGLPDGDWRNLTEAELDALGRLIAHSTGEAETSGRSATRRAPKAKRGGPARADASASTSGRPAKGGPSKPRGGAGSRQRPPKKPGRRKRR